MGLVMKKKKAMTRILPVMGLHPAANMQATKTEKTDEVLAVDDAWRRV